MSFERSRIVDGVHSPMVAFLVDRSCEVNVRLDPDVSFNALAFRSIPRPDAS
jgi:hypothetical protein